MFGIGFLIGLFDDEGNPQTGMFVLYDLGSSYGTFLGTGTRVLQGQPIALRPREQFYLADRGCMFMVNL